MLHRAHVQPCQFFSCPTSICIFRACIYFSIFAQQCTRLFIVLFANNKGEIITLHVHGCSFPTFISRREYRYTIKWSRNRRIDWRDFSKKFDKFITREKLNVLPKSIQTSLRSRHIRLLKINRHHINNYKFIPIFSLNSITINLIIVVQRYLSNIRTIWEYREIVSTISNRW